MLALFVLGATFVGSILFLYGDKLLVLTNQVDIYHVVTGQPIDDDDDSSNTDHCSEPSSYDSSDDS